MSQLLPDRKGFPTAAEVLGGRTLSKRANWWKALVLVNTKYGRVEKPQLRLYAWQWSDKYNAWKQRQKFNFSGASYVPIVIETLEAFLGRGVKEGDSAAATALSRRVRELESQLDRKTVEAATNRIPDMELRVKEFDRLLSRKNVKERDLQRFLNKEYWMFGAKYRRIHREKWAGLKGRNDFMLEKEVGYFDVLELKGPREALFVGGKTPRMSAPLKDAISQMAIYLDYYYKHYLSHKEQTQMDVLYPKGIIVIGRRRESEREALEAHRSILRGHIELLTFDDVLNEAKQVIKTVRKRSRKRT